jgi:hypothetical protein
MVGPSANKGRKRVPNDGLAAWNEYILFLGPCTIQGYIPGVTFDGKCNAELFEEFIIDDLLALRNHTLSQSRPTSLYTHTHITYSIYCVRTRIR